VAVTVFKDTTYSLSTLLEEIGRGEIALPDIQRPFVWKASRVRDLFDSMYRGFPVGYLLFWSTGAEVGARQIGTERKEAAPRLMIVDGQQRLTSLYAVLTGRPVVTSDYQETRIRIAFRPRDASFEVTDAAIEKDPDFIPDIAVLWDGKGRRQAVRDFIKRLESSRGELSFDDRDHLEEAIDRLYDIRNYPFKVVELGADVDESQVADVFVRINSEGVRLAQADFILTLMSVWWEKGRRQLEEFARAARDPSYAGPSPANPFIDPSADQLLRVAAGLAFSRGRLRYVYQVLRGKDPDTGEISPEKRERQFETLRAAQDQVLDLTNWHEYLKSMRRAGYRSRSMITSDNNILFSYLMYLVGWQKPGMDRRTLREVIARWFFMTAITGRYTGSFESQVESDLRRVQDVTDAMSYVAALDTIIETELTNDYWSIRLPSALETSGGYSPTLFAYHASLVLLNATPLFSRLTISELLDPATHAPRSSIEKHHLFPRAYLSRLGIDKTSRRNQIANYAFVEWPDNAVIGDRSPADYFPPLFAEMNAEEQRDARFWHALPEGWEAMEYDEFLDARRTLIADVVRAAFEKLRTGELPIDEDAASERTQATPGWTLDELIEEAETETVEFKSSAFFSYKPDVPERVVTESVIKTVAGFLNAGGGTLAIGIADDGEVLGIAPDLDYKQLDADRYINALTSKLGTALGQSAGALAKIRVESIDEQHVCLVHIAPSQEPVFAKVSKGDRIFFVRINNSTRVLDGPDLISYVRQRWS
jgi:hypothetical protein